MRGLGLFLAVELVDAQGAPNSESTKKVIQFCEEKGLLLFSCGTYKNCIRFMSPVNIGTDLVDEALAILEDAFKRVAS